MALAGEFAFKKAFINIGGFPQGFFNEERIGGKPLWDTASAMRTCYSPLS